MHSVFLSLHRLTTSAALSAALLGGCASMASAPAMVAGGVLTGPNGMTLYTFDKDAADSEATQFRFEPDAAVPSFYWAEQGFGYALSGPVDKRTLMALADSVYAQLNRD